MVVTKDVKIVDLFSDAAVFCCPEELWMGNTVRLVVAAAAWPAICYCLD